MSKIFQHLDLNCQIFVGFTVISTYIRVHSFPINEALNRQSAWSQQSNQNSNKILRDCMTSEILLEKIFLLVKNPESDFDWRNFLQVARLFGEKFAKESFYKSYLNSLFFDSIKKKCERSFYLMFLIAREVIHLLSFGTYHNWYKSTIGEMTYKINKEDFKFVMKMLTRMVEFESDVRILRTHQRIMIQAPPLCREIVSLYKTVIKSKIDNLSGAEENAIEIE